MRRLHGNYISEDGISHKTYSISHLSHSLGCRGCLGDNIIKEPYYQDVRDIMQFHQEWFDGGEVKPFVLDFDLDCFSTECREKLYSWPEAIFNIGLHEKNEYLCIEVVTAKICIDLST